MLMIGSKAIAVRLFSYSTILSKCYKYPELSFKCSHDTLPFGCHGWRKSKSSAFWCGEGDTPCFPSHCMRTYL